MNKQNLLWIAIGALSLGNLAGCVAYEVPYRDAGEQRVERDRNRDGDRDRDGVPNRVDRDRDGDGVPNRQDRRPNDGTRY